MSYTDFTLRDLTEKFGLSVEQKVLFENVQRLTPSAWLLESLRLGGSQALLNEKARSEFIISPILLACSEYVGENYSVYSGVALDVDSEKGLNGECDFLLSRMPAIPELRGPFVVVVEAKKADIEAGIPQCAAQMVAARIFNEKTKNPTDVIHGCVTSGNDWLFLRLEKQEFRIDKVIYYLSDPGMILGIFVAILKGYSPK